MSVYNKTAVLTFPTSGATAQTKLLLTCPGDFMVKRLWVLVRVAGTQVTHTVRLSDLAGAVDYASVTTGTSALGTVVSDDVAEDDRHFAGGTVIQVRNVVNDATASYVVHVLIAHQE